MKIPPVKGTRDFYPDQMRVRNFIIDSWKAVSLRNGFEEYDGPIFEYLKMFQKKSGDEIAEQLFNLTDRGGRELAIRPEITPTLARMVNQKINSLAKPIKWFSVPRLCRAERPQKGRLREFFQWNIDIIGVDDVLADAEVIFTTIDYLSSLGLTHRDIKVKISSRKLLSLFLKSLGIPVEKLDALFLVLDKKAKVSTEVFEQMVSELVDDIKAVHKILEFMDATSIPELEEFIKKDSDEFKAYNEIKTLLGILSDNMGVREFCTFDPSIVRGLAYYTGIVFEVHDVKGDLRAICGGGRYDNLLRDFGGPRISATGMGMGDCVLQILLEERNLLGKQLPKQKFDYFVFSLEHISHIEAEKIAIRLRKDKKLSANFNYKTGNIGKQLKNPMAQQSKFCIVIGEEFKNGKLVVKNMTTGDQKTEEVEEFFANL